MNNEYNSFLKKLEEIHSKKFKSDESYLEGCKANKDLNPKDYKIITNHKLDEYFKKYGNKLEKGKLLAFKKDELWLMDKHAKYWKIENDSDFIYFEVSNNLKPLWITLASLLVACAIAGGVTAVVLLKKGNSNSGSGGEGGGETGGVVLTYKINISADDGANNFYWLGDESDYTSVKTEYVLDKGSTSYKIPCYLNYSPWDSSYIDIILTKGENYELVKSFANNIHPVMDIDYGFAIDGRYPLNGDIIFEEISYIASYHYVAYFYLNLTDVTLDSSSYCICFNDHSA